MANKHSQNRESAATRNPRKLQRLRVMLKIMCVLGLCAVIYVGFSITTSGTNLRHRPSMRVGLAEVKPGEALRLLWEGQPIIVLHRTSSQITSLQSSIISLEDPQSEKSQQPQAMRNSNRSSNPRWFVAFASGTDLGCSVNYLPESVAIGDAELTGAFQDSCRGSYYDLAGRVLSNQSAKKNLQVPDYRLDNNTLILGR